MILRNAILNLITTNSGGEKKPLVSTAWMSASALHKESWHADSNSIITDQINVSNTEKHHLIHDFPNMIFFLFFYFPQEMLSQNPTRRCEGVQTMSLLFFHLPHERSSQNQISAGEGFQMMMFLFFHLPHELSSRNQISAGEGFKWDNFFPNKAQHKDDKQSMSSSCWACKTFNLAGHPKKK